MNQIQEMGANLNILDQKPLQRGAITDRLIDGQEEEKKGDFDDIRKPGQKQNKQPLPEADEELDLDKVDEGLKLQTSQIFFFLGITYRSLNMHDEAILSYQNAIHLNQYYSDCFYNIGNVFFEDKKDYEKAELCYKSALESLDEERSNQMYKRIDDQPLQ